MTINQHLDAIPAMQEAFRIGRAKYLRAKELDECAARAIAALQPKTWTKPAPVVETIQDKVLAVFNGHAIRPREVVKATQFQPREVEMAINQLCKKNLITRSMRGFYQKT